MNQFPKSPTDYRYINSGMWGARAYAAEDLIRRIMEVRECLGRDCAAALGRFGV